MYSSIVQIFISQKQLILGQEPEAMFPVTNMPTTSSLFSTYTSLFAYVMLVRTVIDQLQTVTRQLLPRSIEEKISAIVGGPFGNLAVSQELKLIVDKYDGHSINEIYEAAEIYLPTRITAAVDELRITKMPKDKTPTITLSKGQKVTDEFHGIHLTWEFLCSKTDDRAMDESESKSFKLTFHKKHYEKVINNYIQYVLERAKALDEEKKLVKLYSGTGNNGINLDHPSTFDTLAMDPTVKRELMDDMDRFKKRKGFYKRVGKAWKRGYLLYGPPGTGKSSLIAAMANYLKFDIYDLELTRLTHDSELRRHLLSTKNRSILVIEDIDCTIDLENRKDEAGKRSEDSQSFVVWPPPVLNQPVVVADSALVCSLVSRRFTTLCAQLARHHRRFSSHVLINQLARRHRLFSSRMLGPSVDVSLRLTLFGLLNFVDGLWSSTGDEKIFVLTTNSKEKLDHALLRPSRMDMHIHMSYLTASGFRILASNYLRINDHPSFVEIESLIKEVEVTPAEVAEELMKCEDEDVVLEGLVEFLKTKKEEKMKCDESKNIKDQVKED